MKTTNVGGHSAVTSNSYLSALLLTLLLQTLRLVLGESLPPETNVDVI